MKNPFPPRPLGLLVIVLMITSAAVAQDATEAPAPVEIPVDRSEPDVVAGADADSQMRFFESRIRPLLVQHCFECHAGDSDEGGLRLDVADAIAVGGDSGPAVIAGDPDGSLLMAAIRYDDLQMPPDAPLPAAQQADLERWIRQGAYWPITAADPDHAEPSSLPSTWWAAAPLDPGSLPSPVPGIDSPTVIDRYLDSALHHQGLHRAPPTDRTRLIRRLSYDLLGVPPSPDEIDAFVNDQRPDAQRRLIDRMFADARYGERMARLWLDLVRYAESDGWRADAYRPQAWRYRQFVVDAFNANMPYDQFVALQLAGDEIAPADDQAVAAVGFLRLGIYEYNQRDAEGQWQNIVDEMTDVTADVFLATGLACAKCHDHKFDPIPRADYFHLRSVFEPVLFVDRKSEPSADPEVRATIETLLAELREIEGDDVKSLGDYAVSRFPVELQAMYHKPPDQRNSYEHQIAYMIGRQIYEEGLNGNKVQQKIGKERDAAREAVLEKLRALDADPYAPARWMTVTDAPGPIRPTRLPGRSQGRAFDPVAPSVLGGQPLQPTPPTEAPQSSGRRTALARWITSPDNPITARVIVNRLWQYHFGTGLVDSPNDFGHLGSTPSHPQLLDYLAARLIDSGWDLQSVQRELVSTAAYRQSAVHPDAQLALNIDAGNRLLWHKSVRRLDAEQYRDTLLVAMNSFDGQYGGPSVEGTPPRRSLYLRRFRNTADEMLAALDAPPGIVGTAKRDMTTTATQSLMMLNNARIMGVAKSFAASVRGQVGDPADRPQQFVRLAHRILTGLDPDPETISLLAPLVQSGAAGEVDVCHVLINSNAFLFVD